MAVQPYPVCFWLRHQGGGGSGDERPKDESTPSADLGEGGHALRCLQCRHRITSGSARMHVQGQHRHVFFNPHGLMFEVGCFRQAPGCAVIGGSSEEFTWFAGHRWQVAICARCGLHMGWLFRDIAQGSAFWGLLLPHLV